MHIFLVLFFIAMYFLFNYIFISFLWHLTTFNSIKKTGVNTKKITKVHKRTKTLKIWQKKGQKSTRSIHCYHISSHSLGAYINWPYMGNGQITLILFNFINFTKFCTFVSYLNSIVFINRFYSFVLQTATMQDKYSW